jgi:hypothetical protein
MHRPMDLWLEKLTAVVPLRAITYLWKFQRGAVLLAP